ncbi:MAG: hypothetical protein Phyf2KO_06410 [Phycisphaerales bacterium]
MNIDKHVLYETCVQSPPEMVLMLKAIHGGRPTVLGEDFAGTAALSRHWIETVPSGRAIAVDTDGQTLDRAGTHKCLRTVVGDVREVSDPVDCLFVGNFSIGYLHSRDELISYLRHVRQRLKNGGVFVCDTYGGQTAFIQGSFDRDIALADAKRCQYRWEQREANPITGMVTNAIHFRIFDGDEVVEDIPDAFIYQWRLWSLPELREALLETGFTSTDIYANLPDAIDDEGNAYAEPICDPDWLDDSYIVCIAGRTV